MSGLNPFRPKKPEDPAGPPPSSHSTSGSSYFSGREVPATFPVSDTSFSPSGIRDLPSPNPTPSNDESVSSDDQSVSDPFRQHSEVSDDDGPRRQQAPIPTSNPASIPREFSEEEFRRPRQPGLPSTPPISATAFGLPAGLPARSRTHDQFPGQENTRPPGGNAPVASSNASIRSLTPHGGTRTTNSSVTDVSQTPAHPGIAPYSGVGRDPKPLASRPSNRDKVPPPPPKSHHGKLISPTPGTASSLSQPAPTRPTNRYSYHGSPSETSLSPQLAQSQGDYFGLGEKQQSERPAEALRRSQSQHKRPPTPPLARRHSQMRRSKTTHSKANMRLSMPPIKVDVAAESPPPSPGSWSFNPARTRDVPVDTSSSDENSSQRPPLSIRTSESKSSTPAMDTSASTSPSNPKASLNKRASNPLPPPPPPRRTRGSSNHSSDETRSTSLRSEKQAEEKPAFTPEPSNARDILADLTRLQKEVDDLRGHYENRKASH